jgi:hypothetical protein
MTLQAGDVIYVYCHSFDAPDWKYFVCVCPQHPYFFFVNSQAKKRTMDAQVKIRQQDFPFLTHDPSYIDTSTMVILYKNDMATARSKGSVPTHVREQIVKLVGQSKYLSPDLKSLINGNLNTSIP